MRERDVHGMRLRHAAVIHGRPASTKCLEVDIGIQRTMRREQKLPFAPCAALCNDAAHRMARATGRLGLRVGRVAVLDHATLGLEAAGSQLRRSEALLIAQIPDDRARGGGLDSHSVQAGHASDGHLPAFGSFSFVRDALHEAGAVECMASATVRDRRLIANHEAGGCIGCRST
jgi:hypothetical protein